MINLYTAREMRECEAKAIENGVAETELIRRAGAKLAEVNAYCGSVAIICGVGNNGADGLALACELLKRGKKAEELDVFVFEKDGKPALSEGGAHFFDVLRAEYGYKPLFFGGKLREYAVVADCIFGSGLSREVTGVFADAIDAVNKCGAFVISADIPSGVSSDSGQASGRAVKAALTVAFAGYKRGHYLNDAKDYVGQLTLVDIGIAPAPSETALVCSAQLPARPENSHKNDFGRLCVVGGSKSFCGAPILSAIGYAALRSGAGLCELCVPDCVYDAVAAGFPLATFAVMPSDGETMLADYATLARCLDRADAVAFGMGISRSESVSGLLNYAVENHGKVLIDADGLRALARDLSVLKRKKGEVCLTPHPGEFSALCGISVAEILKNPVEAARGFAKEHSATVLLKGAASVITDGGRAYVVARGSSGQAKGGSGDVLSGIIGALAAEGLPMTEAAYKGAFIAGVAGEIAARKFGKRSALPTDTADCISEALAEERPSPMAKALRYL